MKRTIVKGLLGSLILISWSTAFAGSTMHLELIKGDAAKLSSYTANGTLNERSAYSGAQTDPLAMPDGDLGTPLVDTSQANTSSDSNDAMTTWVTVQGTVRNDDGDLVCAMALANGQYMFTCNPLGSYDLTVPLNSQGQIDLQVFAAGHMPFRQKLPSNQGVYSVVMEIAEDCPPVGEYCGNGTCGIGEDYTSCPADCSAPPPTTYDITINLIDSCNDGLNIEYKYYDTINNSVWPSSTDHWETPGYNLKSTHTLECPSGGNVCIGARSGTRWWGLDLDGSDSCTDCCLTCADATWDWTLNCQ